MSLLSFSPSLPKRRAAREICRGSIALALLTLTGLVAPQAGATIYFWDPDATPPASGGAGLWDTTSNFWESGSAAGPIGVYGNTSNDGAVFSGTAGVVAVLGGTSITANSLTFQTGGYTVTANQQLNVAGIGTLVLDGTLPTIDTGTGNQTLSGAISGTQGFTKIGTGTLTLTGAPAATAVGALTIGLFTATIPNTTGLIVGQAVTGTGLPAGTTVVSIEDGTNFTLSAAATATGTPNLSFTTTQTNMTWSGAAVVNAGGLTVNAGQAAGASFVFNNGTTFSTNQGLSNANVITIRTGTVTVAAMPGTSNFIFAGDGNFIWNAGGLTSTPSNATISAANFLGRFGGTVTWGVANTYRINSGAGTTLAPFATINQAGVGGLNTRDGATIVLGGIASTGINTSLGAPTTSGASTYIIGSANTDTTYAGNLSNNATRNSNLTKVGTGTLTLNRAATGTAYSSLGTIANNGGVLRVDYTNIPTGLFAGASPLSFGGGTFSLLGKTTGATTQTMFNATVNAGGGRLVIDTNGGASTALTLGQLTATAAGGSLNISKIGSGTVTITTPSLAAADGTFGSRLTFGSDWLTGGGTANAGIPWVNATDTVSLAGQANGNEVVFTGTAPGGLTAGVTYFVVAATATTIQLATTPGGTAIVLSNDGAAATVNTQGALAAYSGYAAVATSGTNTANSLATGSVTLTGALTTNSLKVITSGPGQALTLGGNTLALSNGGLLFAGANDYTVSGGLLRSNALTARAVNTVATTTASNVVTLPNTANLAVGDAITGAGIPAATTITAILSGTSLQLSNAATATATVNTAVTTSATPDLTVQQLGTGNLTIAATLGDTSVGNSTVTKAGSGTLTLTGTNTYTGQTFVNGGTLSVSTDHNLGGGNGTITVASSSTASPTVTLASAVLPAGFGVGSSFLGSTVVNFAGTTVTLAAVAGTDLTAQDASWATAANLILNSSTLQATASLTLEEANAGGAAGTTTKARDVLIGGGGGTFEVTGANTLTVSGVVGNFLANQFGPLTKTGTGTLVLNGSNTYTGATRIVGGTLSTSLLADGTNVSGLGNSPGTANALILDGGTLRYTGGAISTNRMFTVTQNGGTVEAAGGGALVFSADLPVMYAGSGARTLTLTGSSLDDNTLTGFLGDGTGGATSLAKTGPGKWVLANVANLHTGTTSVSGGGTLALAAASANNIASSATISVGTGSTLDVNGLNGGGITLGAAQTLTGSGTVAGTVTTVAGTIVAPGSSVGTLNLGGFTLAAGTIANFEFNSSPNNDKILVATSGGFTLNGGGLNLYVENTVNKWTTAGTYNLIGYSGAIGGTGLDATWTTALATNPHILNPQGGLTYAFGTTGSFLTLTITGVPTLTAQWLALTDGNWSTAANWSTNPSVPNGPQHTASFTTAQSSPRTVTLDGSRTVGVLNFDSAAPNGYTLAAGSGTLTLNNGGTSSVVTVISGSHAITAPLALTTNTTVTVTGSASLLNVSGAISNTAGAPTLTKNGTGTLILSGANTFGPAAGTVGTTLALGSIRVGSSGALGAGDVAVTGSATLQAGAPALNLANNVIITAGATATVDTQANTLTLSGVLSETAAAGAVTKLGSGTLVLSGTNLATGATTVSAGTLQLGDGGTAGSVGGNIVNNGALVLNRSDSYVLGNVLTGSGTLTQAGSGTVSVTGANNFAGDTVLSAGILTVDSTLALQGSTLNYNGAGGTLAFGVVTAATFGGLKGSQDLSLLNASAAGVALTVGGNNQSTTYSGILSGAGGAFNKVGNGTVTLTGVSSYGSTFSGAGSLVVGPGAFITNTGAITANNGGNLTVNGGAIVSGALSTFSANASSSFDLVAGTADFNGGIAAGNNDGNLLRVQNGTFTAASVSLQRSNANTVAPTAAAPIAGQLGNGFVINGATANATIAGNLTIGAPGTNSSATARVEAGSLTVGGQVTIARHVGGRWSILQVNGGTFTSTDAVNGVVISPNNGTDLNNGEFYLSGGVATAERISFGDAVDTGGGNGWLIVGKATAPTTSGTLYVGSGGIVQANTAGYISNVAFNLGTLGATADWTSILPATLGGAFTIKAADVANVAHNITLNGILSGVGGITKTGGGDLTLAGANTFTGDTVAAAGAIKLLDSQSLAESVLFYDGQGGTVDFGVLTAASLGGLKGGQSLPSALLTSLNLGNATTTNSTYSAVVNDGAGTLVLTKEGTNTQVFTGTNTYTGGTNINGGILSVGSAGALGSTGPITFAGVDGTLQFTAANTTDYSNRFTTDTAQGFNFDTNGQTVTLASPIVSTGGSLTKIGAGTLTLSGAQTYDTLTVQAGVLESLTAIGTGTSTVNANGGTTNFHTSQTLAALNIGAGAVVTLTATPGFASDGGKFAGSSAVVPEPGALGLLLVGGLGLLNRRRRS